jgi:hypothetical protein
VNSLLECIRGAVVDERAVAWTGSERQADPVAWLPGAHLAAR